jgi:hypothetical protein
LNIEQVVNLQSGVVVLDDDARLLSKHDIARLRLEHRRRCVAAFEGGHEHHADAFVAGPGKLLRFESLAVHRRHRTNRRAGSDAAELGAPVLVGFDAQHLAPGVHLDGMSLNVV